MMAPLASQEQFLSRIRDGESIEGHLYKNMQWHRTAWHGAEIRQCIFEGNRFVEMEWWSCHVDAVVFADVRWSAATLRDCVFVNCRFVDCVFEQTTLNTHQFIHCHFERCVFTACRYTEGSLLKATALDLRIEASQVEKLVLSGNQQVRLRFQDSDFSHLVLTDFDFKDMEIANTRLTNLIALDCVARDYCFRGLHLVQSQFTDSDMAGSDFSHADLSQTCFKSCDLRRCRFDHAVMRQALLLQANAAGAVLASAQLESANFSDADCEHAVFRGAQMNMTILNRCNLQHADFSGCDMPFTDFSYANLSYADFRGGRFMRSKHHAVIDHETRYGSRDGILAPDHALLRAEQWVKLS